MDMAIRGKTHATDKKLRAKELMVSKDPNSRRAQIGPKPGLLHILGDWQTALKKALKKKRPPGGWPKGEAQPKE
jgi:hypothetical protein